MTKDQRGVIIIAKSCLKKVFNINTMEWSLDELIEARKELDKLDLTPPATRKEKS